MQEFILTILKTTGIQIIGVFGIFFFLGYILSKLQEWTQRNYARSVGWSGILWTAWLGTPLHEFGHAFFALIFRHRLNRVKLFSPNKKTGELGQVDHSYNIHSLYQKVGNFFIATAPMLFGSAALALLVYYLLPGGRDVFTPFYGQITNLQSFFSATIQSLKAFYNTADITSGAFWGFVYLSFAISSHLAPSKADRVGMWVGFYWIIIILLLANTAATTLKLNITDYILSSTQYLGILTGLFCYAIVVSLIHWLASSILLWPFKK